MTPGVRRDQGRLNPATQAIEYGVVPIDVMAIDAGLDFVRRSSQDDWRAPIMQHGRA